MGSFSYTSRAAFIFDTGSFTRAGFIFIWGVSLTHPVLASFLSREFLLHIPCLLYFSLGSSLTHPMLALLFCFFLFLSYTSHNVFFSFLFFNLWSFSSTSHAGFTLCGVFLLHIPCYFYFYLRSLTHPVLAAFLDGKFLLHIPSWLFFFFNLGS